MKRKCFMKKYAIALLTLSLSTFAFAGPGQQDTDARLQAAGQVMHEIMAAPDKGIPEEVLIHCRRRAWTRRGYLPHCPRLERAGIHFDRWGQFWLPGRGAVSRPRYVVYE
jgi:hypothetical protein